MNKTTLTLRCVLGHEQEVKDDNGAIRLQGYARCNDPNCQRNAWVVKVANQDDGYPGLKARRVKMSYGQELILDIHECDARAFNRNDLEKYFKGLCVKIGMVRADLHFWDYEGYTGAIRDKENAPDHLAGTSAVQFIQTSNITIHCLDKLGKVFINIFSCKDFNTDDAAKFTAIFFDGKIKKQTVVERI